MKKKMWLTIVFMLATLAWAAAQQSGGTANPSSGQTTSPSSQAPAASQPQPSMPSQDPAPRGMQAGSQGQTTDAPATEGCLGGSASNYTLTDKAGTTYKLNIPSNADSSKLAPHVGEPVQVMGGVKGNSMIDVQAIGPGTGKCPAPGAMGTPSAPK